MFEKDLINFGLTEKEAKIYLALLELEIATANDIAKVSGVKRSSAYVILEKMVTQGFVGLVETGSVQKYVASSPDMFLRIAQEKSDKTQRSLEEVKKMIPELRGLFAGTKQKPTFSIFEGMDGLINAMEEMLINKDGVVRYCTSCEFLMKSVPKYIEEHGSRRIASSISAYAIVPDTKWSRALIECGPKLVKTAYLPVEKYKFITDYSIFDDKVGYMFVQKNKLITAIIHSHEIAEVMKTTFDMAWEYAKIIGRSDGDLDSK